MRSETTDCPGGATHANSIVVAPGAVARNRKVVASGTPTIEFAWVAPPGQSVVSERTVRYDVTVTPSSFFGIL